MIVVDTSALMALLLDEPEADSIAAILAVETETLISAGTVAEALIVSARRSLGAEMAELIDGIGIEIVDVTPATSRRIAAAYERWGRGLHPAGLNFGDCFAYELAARHACPLLFVGRDFARTDLQSALDR